MTKRDPWTPLATPANRILPIGSSATAKRSGALDGIRGEPVRLGSDSRNIGEDAAISIQIRIEAPIRVVPSERHHILPRHDCLARDEDPATWAYPKRSRTCARSGWKSGGGMSVAAEACIETAFSGEPDNEKSLGSECHPTSRHHHPVICIHRERINGLAGEPDQIFNHLAAISEIGIERPIRQIPNESE